MEFKILITGRNRKIASSDISKLLEKELECTVIVCPPLKSKLADVMFYEKPSVALIFVKDEDQRDIKVYDIIRDCSGLYDTTVIVVADEINRKMFTRNSRLRKILFLPHDIPFSILCDRLNEVKAQMKESEEKTQFIVYDNTEADEAVSKRKHILVADDDPQQLVQIKEHLSEFYDVTLINSGKKEIRCLEKYRTDLIFLDYLMPEFIRVTS